MPIYTMKSISNKLGLAISILSLLTFTSCDSINKDRISETWLPVKEENLNPANITDVANLVFTRDGYYTINLNRPQIKYTGKYEIKDGKLTLLGNGDRLEYDYHFENSFLNFLFRDLDLFKDNGHQYLRLKGIINGTYVEWLFANSSDHLVGLEFIFGDIFMVLLIIFILYLIRIFFFD